MNKKKKYLIGIIILLILSLLFIPKLKFLYGEESSESASRPKLSAISVKAIVAKGENLENRIFTTGTLIANEEVELKSEVSGKITQILFREGGAVNKGDLLLKINDADLQAQLKRSEYKLKLAEDKEYRQKRLLEIDATSQENYDLALNELNSIKAEIELIKAQIEKTEVKAPFNGIIGLKYVSEGSYISPSVRTASLQSISTIKLDFSIPEKYAPQVKLGDLVNFKIQGSDKKYTAKVYAIEPKIDLATRTLQIRALTPNPGKALLPGSFADVELVLNQYKDAIMVPTEALVPELKGQKVFVYRSGKAVPVNIELGTRTEKSAHVLKGLSLGDTVITSGTLQIRSGMAVKISELN